MLAWGWYRMGLKHVAILGYWWLYILCSDGINQLILFWVVSFLELIRYVVGRHTVNLLDISRVSAANVSIIFERQTMSIPDITPGVLRWKVWKLFPPSGGELSGVSQSFLNIVSSVSRSVTSMSFHTYRGEITQSYLYEGVLVSP